LPETTCLYCPEPALSLEHIIPAALGEFENAPLLRDRICNTCNNWLGLLDEQMVRSDPEAFIRRYYNITGRPGHDRVNPFYRGSAGGHRLEMKVFDLNLGFEILMERADGNYRQLRQLVFIEQPIRDAGVSLSVSRARCLLAEAINARDRRTLPRWPYLGSSGPTR
jgi:hypothetical protein